MADITKLSLNNMLTLTEGFDLESALQGNLVGYTITADDGTTIMHTGTLRAPIGVVFGDYGAVYAVKDGTMELLFDRQGNCVSPEYKDKVQLHNVTATMPEYEDNKVVTRGETSVETATINSVRPIDQFAIAIIQSLLQKMDRPQEMSESDILKWSAVAYRWAEGMFAIATSYRTANDSMVSTNSDSVKESIDNVVGALNALITVINTKVVQIDNVENGTLKVSSSDNKTS